MKKYSMSENILDDSAINFDYPIKIQYSNNEKLNYTDPALLFTSIQIQNIPLLLENISQEKAYLEEHKSLIFGPMPKSYDSKEIKSDEVCIFYIDTEYIALKTSLFEFCLQYINVLLLIINKYDFFANGIFRLEDLESMEESKNILLSRLS